MRVPQSSEDRAYKSLSWIMDFRGPHLKMGMRYSWIWSMIWLCSSPKHIPRMLWRTSNLILIDGDSEPHHILQAHGLILFSSMRTHLFFGTFQFMKASWHTEASKSRAKSHTWQEHIPYTNALWIGYIFEFLYQGYMPKSDLRKRSKLKLSPEQKVFERETAELRRRLTPGWRNAERFTTASEILEFAVEQGWVTPAQVEDYGTESSIVEGCEIR